MLIEDEPSDTLAVIHTNEHRAQPYKIRTEKTKEIISMANRLLLDN